MLVLWPNCQVCGCDLPPDSTEALICTMECTHCTACNDELLHGVCPNCGGNLVPRPIRPKGEYRRGEGLSRHPAGTQVKRTKYSNAEIAELSARLRDVPATGR
jgi:hypothetical protein